MARSSISFTAPNDEWLQSQVYCKEYSSKTELVNDLIRKARNQQSEDDYIRSRLELGLQSGISTKSKEEILAMARLNAGV